jgi:hypothetical protein
MSDERNDDRPGRDRPYGGRGDEASGRDRGESRNGRYKPGRLGPAQGRRVRAEPGRDRPVNGTHRRDGRTDRDGSTRARTTSGRSGASVDPPTDPEITGRELDDDVRSELSTLSGGAAGAVARHLVMAGRLIDDDPALAYEHALAARRRAARVGVVREAAGVAAYAAGRYSDALSELRAARRITGSPEYLPMMADSERGLGRPRRALDLAADPAVAGLDIAGRIEMLIVAAGARRDLGQLEAAAVSLQIPELRSRSQRPWVARLRYAYADALAALGRVEEARHWFVKASEADRDDETEALDRIAELDGRTPGDDGLIE